MRKTFFWSGWIVLLTLPLLYCIEIVVSQDLPPVQLWKWLLLLGSVVVIFLSRNTDDVLKHHLA